MANHHKMFGALAALFVAWAVGVVYFFGMTPDTNVFVTVTTFECPDGYPVKANRESMIYHEPGGRYYSRTSAAKGDCFDDAADAIANGFRAALRP